MEMVTGIAVLYGIAWALVHGTERAARSLRRTYRVKLRAFVAASGEPHNNTRAASIGAKAAATLATGVLGLGYAAREFTAGWRDGWPKGMEKARDHWARREMRPDGEPEPQPETAAHIDPPAPEPGPEPEPALETEPDPQLPEPTPVPAGTDTTGGTDMAIETVTHGEITSMDTLLAELDAVITEATDNLEDAQADERRAGEDLARIEMMVASCQAAELDSESIAEVGALTDPAEARRDAARARVAAEESRVAFARAARENIAGRHQAMQEAVAATPGGGARREFYTNV